MPPPVSPAGRLLVAAVFLLGFWQLPLRAVGWMSDIPGDWIDSRFNHYILEHGYQVVAAGEPGRFWHPPFMFPAPGMTAGSDHHLGTLPLYAGLRAGGLDMEAALQVWYLVLAAVNFPAAVWAARRIGLGAVGAAAAGYLFAFGLPAVAQTGHLQLTARFLVPVAVAAGWGFLRQPSAGRLFAAGAAIVGQLYLNMYLGLLTGGVLAALAVAGRAQWREVFRLDRHRLLAVGGAGLLALPLVVQYLRMAVGHGTFGPEYLITLAPDPAAWVRPPAQSATWGWVRDRLPGSPEIGEKVLFPGVLALLGLGYAVWLSLRRSADPRRPLAVAVVLVVLAMLVVFWPVCEWSIYRGLVYVPGVGLLRAVGRVVLVLIVPLGWLAGMLCDDLIIAAGRWGRIAGGLTAVGLAGLVPLDHATPPTDAPVWAEARFPVSESVARRTRFADAVRAEPGATLLYAFPPVSGDALAWLTLQVDMMWAGLETGVPTVNGYTGYPPPGWGYFGSHVELLGWLHSRGADTPDRLAGLRTFGTPYADDHDPTEQAYRRRFGGRPLP